MILWLKYLILIIVQLSLVGTSFANKKKVGQSGMTYLAISMCSRENAMGDAATATVKGINGIWHNPSTIADIDRFAVSLNQVSWLVDTQLSGAAIAFSFGNWGTIGFDLTYMDFGDIAGTQPVDKSINPRGFILSGNVDVEDYAYGFSYARRINNKFTLGFKIKRVHESLGDAYYVVDEYDDPDTGEKIRTRELKKWQLDDWGLDFGTVYNTGWKNLSFAMTLQNFSRDMKYFYDEFQLPMTLRMGLAMDISDLILPTFNDVSMLVALDASHPNDYTERVHMGYELVYMEKFALRTGYKFNHDVESLTLGFGINFNFSGIEAVIDYAYTSAHYFKDISRFSLSFLF